MTTTDFTRVKDHFLAQPKFFFRVGLGVENLYDKQLEMADAVRDFERVAVCGANGTGKDFMSARIMLWWMMVFDPAKVIVIGPTHRQVSDIVFSEARLGFHQAQIPLRGTFLQTSQWKIADDCYALGFATTDAFNLQGFHSANLLVIITEAHNMPQAQIENIKRLLPKCTIMTGNPFCAAGEFYDAFNGGDTNWHTIKISAFDTPNLQQHEVVIPGMATDATVAQMADDWGEDSPDYIGSVLGEFPDSLEDTVVARSLVQAAIDRTIEPDDDEDVWFSVDVARFGNDRSVVYRRKGHQCEKVLDVQGHDTQQLAGEIGELAEAEPEDIEVFIIIDDTGVGGGVTDRLNEESGTIRGGNVTIIPFLGGEKADNDQRYVNAIAEAWLELGRALKAGMVDLDDNPAMLSQLSSRKYQIQGDRRLKLESKEDYKKRIKRSPDDADALAQLYSPLCGSVGFRLFE